jgi:uncharacterized protein YbbC (DUF1343 family)
MLILALTVSAACLPAYAQTSTVKLGNELLMDKYHDFIMGKRVGLITNQSGVDSRGVSTIDKLAADSTIQLAALYGPEHGIDGTALAGQYVESYTHKELGIPVYSLYGNTRKPTGDMLKNIDVLVFDIQDIGARSYTYMSTLNYCMIAARDNNKTVIVLDRPNPLGGETVSGPVLEDPYKTFVGVDNLPMAHGMTAGELANFFNRNIGADLKVVPMEGYTRSTIYQDTGLQWVPTSPNIPDIDSVFGYMATGLGEGTGIRQADKFKWIGGKGIDANKFANLLNQSGLQGVNFIPEIMGDSGGVRLQITDYRTYDPAKSGIYALAYAHTLNNFKVPQSGETVVMFDKIMGTNKIGQYLTQGLTPMKIEANYTPALNKFKEERQKYLIYGYGQSLPSGGSGQIVIKVRGSAISFDSPPYIDKNNRVIVPVRAIVEALGAEAGWDSKARTVTVRGGGNDVVFKIDSRYVVVNGQTKTMDTTPVIKNNRTMLPARYVAEYLGAEVLWDPGVRTVDIS